MKRFEYSSHFVDFTSFTSTLNEYGKNGWELVYVLRLGPADLEPMCTLKREINSACVSREELKALLDEGVKHMSRFCIASCNEWCEEVGKFIKSNQLDK